MTDTVHHPTTPELAAWRKELAPDVHEAFETFSRAAFSNGALPEKTKQLIAVAVAHVTQCPYGIRGHTELASREGASPEEIMESIWVATEMRAGGAYAHAAVIDLDLTRVVDDTLVKIMAWYDNEWGFTHQMIREARVMLGLPPTPDVVHFVGG